MESNDTFFEVRKQTHEMLISYINFEWNHLIDNNQPKNELNDRIILEESLLLANHTTPLSNRYQIAATNDNTRRAYQADIRHFLYD